jgi:hypothetical protein
LIVAGLMTPWFGVARRARAVMDWMSSAGPLVMRLDAGVAMGGFLVYVFRTPIRHAV